MSGSPCMFPAQHDGECVCALVGTTPPVTAAPGPQQPDEVPSVPMCRHGRKRWVEDCKRCIPTPIGPITPAAPSAQPMTCGIPGCYGQMPHCGFAQPDRVTGQGATR